jgi:hypothetical protein
MAPGASGNLPIRPVAFSPDLDLSAPTERSSMINTTMTLNEKVEAVASAESSVIDRFSTPPFDGPKVDTRDWHLYFGIAVGLARTDEPCEPISEVGARARKAANETFSRLNWDSPAAGAVADEINREAEVTA